MKSPKKVRRGLRFRPSVSESTLEDRVALSSFAARLSGAVNIRFLQQSRPAPLAQISASSSRAQALIQAQQTRQMRISTRQFRDIFIRQFHTALRDLRSMINAQSAQLFASGTPTPQQLTDFNQFVNGAVNAAAFRVSSLAALLPGSSARLVPGIQQAFLGSGPASLVSRIQFIATNPNLTTSTALQNALSSAVVRTFLNNQAQLRTFFNTTNLGRLSVNQFGQPIPLPQFIGSQVVSQFGNTLGLLAQGVPTLANTTLFANGVTTPTLTAQQAFAQQLGQALGLAAFQLGGNLSLFPAASTTLIPQLQPLLFGTGTGTNSLLTTLQGVPLTATNFSPAVTSAFTTTFPTLINPLNTFFGLPAATPLTLPAGTIPSIFNTAFLDFGAGFNSGFGTGFPGFGTFPTTFNPNFSTGFFNMITGLNPTFGFTQPTFAFTQPTLGFIPPIA